MLWGSCRVLALIYGATLVCWVGGALADDLTIDDARVQYGFTQEVRGPLHFCDLVTSISKAPIVVKLTSAFITDDGKPKENDLSVAYIVEAFVVTGKSPADVKQVRVLAGRINSDIFHTDLNATKGKVSTLGASYLIPSEGSLSLFLATMTRGKFALVVELENQSTVTLNVRPSPEIFDPTEKWSKCSIAIMEHRPVH
jgi:hypothetical protein